MSKFEKKLEKMRHNPRDWRIEDVEAVARHFGLVGERPSGGSSHVTFRHFSGGKITIPAHRPIKPIYIKLLIQLIDEIEL